MRVKGKNVDYTLLPKGRTKKKVLAQWKAKGNIRSTKGFREVSGSSLNVALTNFLRSMGKIAKIDTVRIKKR